MSRLGDLRDKLAKGNLTRVEFLIVNDQDAYSRAMYWELKRRVAEGIPVYQQSPLQPNVWDTLQGDKDDVLVYDRYGQTPSHQSHPFSQPGAELRDRLVKVSTRKKARPRK